MTNEEIEMEALITEREGLVAENNQRLACGSSMAYGREHFDEIAERMRALQESRANEPTTGQSAPLCACGKPAVSHLCEDCIEAATN